MLNSRYRFCFIPAFLIFLALTGGVGCRLEIVQAQEEERIAEPPEAAEAPAPVEVNIRSGKIIVDGDTLACGEPQETVITIVNHDEDEETAISIKRGDVVRFGEKIKVKEGEKIRGSVVSIGGDIVVRGIVEEDAVSIGGDVYVASTGDVNGSAVSIGGSVTREPGGRIGEDEVSLGPGWFPAFWIFKAPGFHEPHFRPPFFFGGLGHFLIKIFWLAMVVLIGMGIVLLFPKQLDIVEQRVRTSPGKAGLIGFLAEILIVPLLVLVIVLLCITIIGIPLLIFVIPLFCFAVIAAFFLGYIGMANVTAKLVEARAGLDMGSPYVRVALGVLILMLAGLIARVLRLGGGTLGFIATLFAMISWMIFYLACTIGLGAVVMTRFGTVMSGAGAQQTLPGKEVKDAGTETAPDTGGDTTDEKPPASSSS